MFLRILSIGGPLWVYATTAGLIYGLFLERRRFEWIALVPAAAGLIASVLFLAPIHRLFFDEDLYINVASNLTRAPVNQRTILGAPHDIQISTYPKEPAGWPVLLSFAFLVAGPSEAVAFWFARVLFALAIAAIYHLARALFPERRQALTAAIMFGATPICFWYSVSAGTDMTAALMAVLGMWGLVLGNGALAAAGFAFAAQTRMELLLLVPLVWISPRISSKWKIAAAGLALFEIVHVAWVMSVAPVLERAEEVQSAFGLGHVGQNLLDNLEYLFNPFDFPIMVSLLATLSLWERAAALGGRVRVSGLREPLFRLRPSFGAARYRAPSPDALKARWPLPKGEALPLWIFGLFAVYLAFYAGSFDINTRYSIQIVAPLTVLAASFAKRPVWIAALLISAVVPATRAYASTPYFQALEADHQLCVQFASHIDPDDLVISGVQEIFIDNGRPAINASFASMMSDRFNEEIRKRKKVWYHSGVRSTIPNTDEWRADRWVKSNFELHLIESHDVNGFRISFYEILAKRIDREAR
jgi:4-amino-4-deoxy-L-arabinose transferase-like glycosyltransferase